MCLSLAEDDCQIRVAAKYVLLKHLQLRTATSGLACSGQQRSPLAACRALRERRAVYIQPEEERSSSHRYLDHHMVFTSASTCKTQRVHATLADMQKQLTAWVRSKRQKN